VRYPDLPDPFDPAPDEWLRAIDRELAAMGGERIVLCHSLACLLWLRHAQRGGEPRVARVLLVAPPRVDDVPAVVRFQADGVTADDVRAAAGRTLMLCSDNDPYCPEGAATVFGAPLELDFELLPGRGHLNPDAGFGPWPAVEAWALGAG
jgi:predicted alpha/beta hydrolase family esterase